MLCSIRIRQFNGKTTVFIFRRFVLALSLRNESNVLIKLILYLSLSTTYLFSPCDFKWRLTEPLRDKVLYGTCLRECVFVSKSVYARLKFRILLSCFRVMQGSQHV